MSFYSDQIASIKKARDVRDKAKDDLYKTQLQYFALIKDQKKFSNKEMVTDEATSQAINSLRIEIAEVQKQINIINQQLQMILDLTSQIKAITAQRDALTADISKLKNQIADIDHQLADQSIPQSKRDELEAQKKILLDKTTAEQAKIDDLNKQIDNLQRQLSILLDKQGSLIQQKQQLQANLAELQKRLETLITQGQKFSPDKTQELSGAKRLIAAQTAQLKERNTAVQTTIGGLYGQFVPQQLIEQWNDGKPIMLFPVRIETKYHMSGTTSQLWVRIFPDDIAVVTHEQELTQSEIDAGVTHWKTLWFAKGDTTKKQASWMLLSSNFRVNRASWIAIQTKPLNWSSSGSLESENDLQFPVFDTTKPATWTQAPHTRIMPDKFVLHGYRGGVLQFSKIGNQIDDIVVLGPSPLADGENPSITRSEDNKLQYSDDFKWLVDFDIAIQSGLGFIITDKDLSSGNTIINGFDRLIALGVKLSSDENDGKKMVEDLLNNHNFSTEGLSLIKQGTPTNNTEEKDAGYSKKGSIDNISDYIENGTPLFEFSNDKNTVTDGQRLAEYLGIAYAPLQLVPNSQLKENVEAVAMNKALYATTLGYYLQSMLNDVMSDTGMLQVRNHFTNYVTGRGPIAAIRVGNQPYGIIPTSVFSRWKYSQGPIILEAIGNDFYNQMYKVLSFLQSIWQSLVPQLSYIHKSGDPGANLMNVLGLNPTSVEFFQRVGYSWDYLKNLEQFSWGGRYFGDVFKTILDGIYVKQILRNLGYNDRTDSNTPKPVPLLLQLVFQHYHTQLDNNNLIDGLPSSEETTVNPYDKVNNLNYIDWLIAKCNLSPIKDEAEILNKISVHVKICICFRTKLTSFTCRTSETNTVCCSYFYRVSKIVSNLIIHITH